MLAFLFGTLVTSILALIFAVPLSIGIALFMTEVAPGWLKTPVIYVMDLLSVVPSVVFGLWGVLVLATPISHFYTNVSNVLSPIPIIGGLFAEPVNGRSFFTAGLILAIMIVPIITSLTREVFDTTPRSEKEAALALGATRWEMIRGSVFAHSKGGMVGAVTLGLGRAMGETIAVALVIGSSPQITEKLFSPGYSMPSVIANEFGESSGNYRAGAHRARRGALHHLRPREPHRPNDRQPIAREVEGRMTATLTPTPDLPEIDFIDLRPKRSGRRVRNGIATALMGFSVVAVLVPLLFVLGSVIQKGASVLSWSFLTDDIPPVRRQGPGMGPAVVGTIVITATAAAMAIPLGILGAVYLQEYGKTGKLAQVLRFFADVMTGVPSIIMGLFIYTFWVVRFGVNGVTGFAGSLALACLMLPIIIRSTEEMLKLVPDDLRGASFALGSSKARTVWKIVLPAAFPGILSGVLLAVARAAGETAPLLFTIGAATQVNWNVFKGPNTALSAQIFTNAQQPFVGAQERAWGAALTLIIISFALLVAARVVAARFGPARGR